MKTDLELSFQCASFDTKMTMRRFFFFLMFASNFALSLLNCKKCTLNRFTRPSSCSSSSNEQNQQGLKISSLLMIRFPSYASRMIQLVFSSSEFLPEVQTFSLTISFVFIFVNANKIGINDRTRKIN